MAASAHHAQVLPFLLHSFFSPSSSSPIVVSFSGSWHMHFRLAEEFHVSNLFDDDLFVLVPGLFS
jgi:hypothetical protein